jgi:hypothetical protein
MRIASKLLMQSTYSASFYSRQERRVHPTSGSESRRTARGGASAKGARRSRASRLPHPPRRTRLRARTLRARQTCGDTWGPDWARGARTESKMRKELPKSHRTNGGWALPAAVATGQPAARVQPAAVGHTVCPATVLAVADSPSRSDSGLRDTLNQSFNEPRSVSHRVTLRVSEFLSLVHAPNHDPAFSHASHTCTIDLFHGRQSAEEEVSTTGSR